ncbi:hypothetical protein FHW79_002262 [Azospirillum sp. OGB3]|nr:hypothetical protein [Azospirillum sp. OGB3]
MTITGETLIGGGEDGVGRVWALAWEAFDTVREAGPGRECPESRARRGGAGVGR